MMEKLIIASIALALISCETDISKKNVSAKVDTLNVANTKNTNITNDTTQVKNWLRNVITNYINNNDLKVADSNLQTSLTENYYNYKHDAIALEYSEWSHEEFVQKWEKRYDTKYVGRGDFFTSVADHGQVDITNCYLLKSLDSAMIFHTVIDDLRWSISYVMDITVVSRNNRLFVDDVRVWNMRHSCLYSSIESIK